MSLFPRILALAGLVALAGCDSGTEAPPAGPVVQFGASAASVLEGSVRADSVATTTVGTRVSIPVRLTGANGTPVTVEVLYASGVNVSTARPGVRNADGTFPRDVDFVDFGSTSEGQLKATVTFSGAADETQIVTFTVVRDGIGEVSETAVFALQRVSGATIGSVREFTTNIGVPTISVVRRNALSSTVTTEGIVTRALGRNVWIQDETGATVLFGPAGSPIATAITRGSAPNGVTIGDRIQSTGRLIEFQATTGLPGTGLLEVDSIVEGAFQVLSRAQALPAPQVLTLAQINAATDDRYESEIVRVTGLTIDPAGDVTFSNGTGTGKNYTVSQTVGGTTTTAILRIASAGDTAVTGTPIPTGPFTFEGPVGQFRGTYQLNPVATTDIVRATN